MPTREEIKAKYQTLHDDLSNRYYKEQELSKEEFDTQHGQIWGSMRDELIQLGYLTASAPSRDYGQKLDELKSRVEVLESAKLAIQ